MIHVALFSFQRTTLSFEALASSDLFSVPHLFRTVKNFFIFLFCLKGGRPAGPVSVSTQGTLSYISCWPVSRGDLYYITGVAPICQQLFRKKSQKIPHHRRASRLNGECGIPASILPDLTCGSDCILPTRRGQSSRRRTFRVSLSVDDGIVISLGDLVVAARCAATLKVAYNGRACARAELSQ